jgi:ketosteroid isomerase-like protein
MDDQEIRAALERHWSDINDQDVVHEIYHDDVVLEFPQGGERLVGRTNVRAMRDAYPSRLALRTERIRGSGDLWVAENVINYDGTKSMHTVNIMEFRDGKVVRETIYFGDPWEPPAWRAQWVELVERVAQPVGQGTADAPQSDG